MTALDKFGKSAMTNLSVRNKLRLVFLAIGVVIGVGQLRRAPSPQPYAAPTVMPPLGTAEKLGDGVLLYKVELAREPEPSHLWIYLPEKLPETPLPCVLIAPAGTRLFHGMTLGNGDMPEHIPYVKAGFAVVAYELDGDIKDDTRGKEIIAAALRFKSAGAGVDNAKTALEYALARIPNIDKGRIFTAGHSSAATVSLLVAAYEPRIKACIAYAPGTDVEAWVGAKLIGALKGVDPDYPKFVHDYSPINVTEQLRCPTLVFHANDDTTVNQADVTTFVEKLKKTSASVAYVEVPRGGHYQSMIEQGIPQGIAWLKRI